MSPKSLDTEKKKSLLPVRTTSLLIFGAVCALITFLKLVWEDESFFVKLSFNPDEAGVESKTRSEGEVVPKEKFKLDVNSWSYQVNTKKDKPCYNTWAGPATEDYPHVLPKKVFSKKVRFVFVMGLEGTGHHTWEEVFTRCPNCQCPPRIENFTFGMDKMQYGLFGVRSDEAAVKDYVDRMVRQLPKLVSERNNSDESVTYLLNTLCVKKAHYWSVGQMSYPNFNNGCRSWSNPDVRLMAEIFESLGYDFRVMVLLRDALDILISTTIHRSFGSFGDLGHKYANIAREDMVHNQLERLDPRFFKCLSYGDLPHIPADMGTFLNVDQQHGSDYFLDKTMLSVYHNTSRTKVVKGNEMSQHDRYIKNMKSSKSMKGKLDAYNDFNEAVSRLEKLCNIKLHHD